MIEGVLCYHTCYRGGCYRITRVIGDVKSYHTCSAVVANDNTPPSDESPRAVFFGSVSGGKKSANQTPRGRVSGVRLPMEMPR